MPTGSPGPAPARRWGILAGRVGRRNGRNGRRAVRSPRKPPAGGCEVRAGPRGPRDARTRHPTGADMKTVRWLALAMSFVVVGAVQAGPKRPEDNLAEQMRRQQEQQRQKLLQQRRQEQL